MCHTAFSVTSLYYQDKVVILIYLDDCIMFSPEQSSLDQVVKDMHESSRKFNIKDLGDIKEFLLFQVHCQKDRSITLTQPQLIDSILHELNFQDNTKGKESPALSTVILQRMPQVNHSTMNFTTGVSSVNSIS